MYKKAQKSMSLGKDHGDACTYTVPFGCEHSAYTTVRD